MIDIWEQRVSGPGAVMHGAATLFIAWRMGDDGRWQMRGSFWDRGAAEAAASS